jgi:hypothetical protein
MVIQYYKRGISAADGNGVYRHLAEKWQRLLAVAVKLPMPLAEFPMLVGSWRGQDVEMSEAVKETAGNDDYICRQYVNERMGQSVYLHVAFSARPCNMRGTQASGVLQGDGMEQYGQRPGWGRSGRRAAADSE